MLSVYSSRPGPQSREESARRVAKARKLRAKSDPVAVSNRRAKPLKESK